MKLGIIGSGMIARMTLADIQAAGIDVVAIAGTPRSEAATRELAGRYGIPTTSTDYRELLGREDIDVIYVAVPNQLHHQVTMEALAAGKSVICEKPLAATHEQALELAEAARKAGLFLWDAMVPFHQPSFFAMRESVSQLGTIRLAVANYSQFSSRYDRFLAGDIQPAFNPACAGGAIMDLGVYCLSFLVGLLGEPQGGTYVPNMDRGVDTSGIATLDYGDFKAVSICAKDCNGPSTISIQGTRGYLATTVTPNDCGEFTLCLNDGTQQVLGETQPTRFLQEFIDFRTQWESGDLETCYAELDRSLAVSKLLHQLRLDAGIVFPTDSTAR